MMRRICRISAVVLCIGLLTWIPTACFGSGDESTDSTSPVTVPSSDTTASTSPVNTTEASTLIDGLPSEYVNALGQRPIVVLFYSPGGLDDEKVLSAVRELRSSYSSYTFLTYDYRIPAAYGDLSQLLEIDYPPQIVLIKGSIDEQGAVAKLNLSGYIDKVSLNQYLLNLGRD